MEIKVLTPAEAIQFRRLIEFGLTESPKAFSDHLTEAQKLSDECFAERLKAVGEPPESFVLGAFAPELVGTVSFKRDPRHNARIKSLVTSMYIHPDYRTHGVGTKLMVEVLRRARELPGLEKVQTWVINSETSARDFYLRFGFNSACSIPNNIKINGEYLGTELLVLEI